MSELDLFTTAIAIEDSGARNAFLDKECAGKADLRRRLDRLLEAHFSSQPLLDQPPLGVGNEGDAGTWAGDDPEDAAPQRPRVAEHPSPGMFISGKYKLLQRIGEGGMGTVWMADQLSPVRRLVAVKLIRAEREGSHTILARFEAERQAIALMNHPHIARLLDAGATAGGAPFFVMELVKGVPLTQFCDEHRLNLSDRLGLFVQICSAVQHAHQKGLIHRDLKPSNILVEMHDEKAVPKVIDFGLAKAISGQQLTEHTLYTGLGQVAGTLMYMAPEQAKFNAIDVDTRTDVYALGVIMYELLTGSTPIERETIHKSALDEVLRVIREQEPPPPSSRLSSTESKPSIAAQRQMEPAKLGRFLRGELDWIVMKALAKERERRYETASGFAKDIERFLNHEPITAAPPSAAYRLKKFIKRNRAQVITASLVLLALVAGIIGTSIGFLEARRQAGIAFAEADAKEQARQAEAAEREKAVEERHKAEQAEADMLASYRANTDDVIEELIGSKAELGLRERTYLENTLKRWQAFAQRKGDDERNQAMRAEGHFRVAFLWQKLGRPNEAHPEYEQAQGLLKKLAEQYPAVPFYQQKLAYSHNDLGNLLKDFGQFEAARTEFEQARDLQKKLTEHYSTVTDYQLDLATTHNNLGNLLTILGLRDAARTAYEQARGLEKKLVELDPAMAGYQQVLASTHNNLGSLLQDLGQQDAARTELEQARGLLKTLTEQYPTVPAYLQVLASTNNNLGILLKRLGQRDAARAEYEEARGQRKKLVEQYPTVPIYQQDLAQTQFNLAILLGDLGLRDAARAEYEQALGLQKKLAEQYPAVPAYQHDLASTHHSLGLLLENLGQRDAGRAEYEQARDLRKTLATRYPTVPQYQQELVQTHYNLANLLENFGQSDAARAEYEQICGLQKKLTEQYPAVPEYQLELARTHITLGGLLKGLGRFDAARVEYEQARDVRKKLAEQYPAAPEYQQQLARANHILGNLLNDLGQRDAARAEYEKARVLYKKLVEKYPAVPVYQQELARTYNNLGNLVKDLGQHDAARAVYEQALCLQKKLAEQDPSAPQLMVDLCGTYCNLGNLLRDEGRSAESLGLFDQAIAVLEPIFLTRPRNVIARQFLLNCHLGRAEAYDSLKKYAEAIKDLDRAIELSPPAVQVGLRIKRAKSHLRAAEAEKAIAEAASLTKSGGWNGDGWYNLACFYSLASGKIADKKQEYAENAMELLRKAVEAGYKDAIHMAEDSDLELLRTRDDFKKLLADLKKAAESKQQEKKDR